MRRIYFLVPDISMAKRIVDDLLLARIEEPLPSRDRKTRHTARRSTGGEPATKVRLRASNAAQPCYGRGGRHACGARRRSVSGSAVCNRRGVLLATSLTGAGVGAWPGGMVEMNAGNTRLLQFADAIEGGALLLMADVPHDRVNQIEERVKAHLPEVQITGTKPTIPPFP
jgi:hypothetical protein